MSMKHVALRAVLAFVSIATAGCQHAGQIVTGLLELPGTIDEISRTANAMRSRSPGSPPTPSDEEAAVIEQEHEQRMRPLQIASADLLAGETYWLRGTARFLLVIRSKRPERAVLGLEVAESEDGSRVHVICATSSECPAGSQKLRVETMRWLRKNQLESAEPTPGLDLADAELDWRRPSINLVRDAEVTPLRDLPDGAEPYAAAMSPDGALALVRMHSSLGDRATVVRIPERSSGSL